MGFLLLMGLMDGEVFSDRLINISRVKLDSRITQNWRICCWMQGVMEAS